MAFVVRVEEMDWGGDREGDQGRDQDRDQEEPARHKLKVVKYHIFIWFFFILQ